MVLTEIAQGLADAHAAGVVHRDLKPSNILISSDGGAKIADFGIAKGLDLTRVTGTSTLLGTPAYLPPEGPDDERSDLYSLGVIAYEMLAGVVPFEGRTYQEVILRHVREAPDLAKIPDEARPIVGWLLEKDPKDRPQTAGKLVEVLWGGAKSPPAPRIPAWESTQPPSQALAGTPLVLPTARAISDSPPNPLAAPTAVHPLSVRGSTGPAMPVVLGLDPGGARRGRASPPPLGRADTSSRGAARRHRAVAAVGLGSIIAIACVVGAGLAFQNFRASAPSSSASIAQKPDVAAVSNAPAARASDTSALASETPTTSPPASPTRESPSPPYNNSPLLKLSDLRVTHLGPAYYQLDVWTFEFDYVSIGVTGSPVVFPGGCTPDGAGFAAPPGPSIKPGSGHSKSIIELNSGTAGTAYKCTEIDFLGGLTPASALPEPIKYTTIWTDGNSAASPSAS